MPDKQESKRVSQPLSQTLEPEDILSGRELGLDEIGPSSSAMFGVGVSGLSIAPEKSKFLDTEENLKAIRRIYELLSPHIRYSKKAATIFSSMLRNPLSPTNYSRVLVSLTELHLTLLKDLVVTGRNLAKHVFDDEQNEILGEYQKRLTSAQADKENDQD